MVEKKKKIKSFPVLLCGGLAGVCAKSCESVGRVRILAQTRPIGGTINPFALGAEFLRVRG